MATLISLIAGARPAPRIALAVLAAAIGMHSELVAAQAQPAPGVIQLLNQVEALQAEINRLRGQLEVVNNGLENAQKRQRDMYLDLDTRLRRFEQQSTDGHKADAASPELEARLKRLEQQAGAAPGREQGNVVELEARIKRLEQALSAPANIPPPVAGTAQGPAAPEPGPVAPVAPVKPTPPAVTAATPATSSAAPASPEQVAVRRAYDSAIAAYKAGDYQGAIATFDGIVKRFPRDALASNAQYWIGDSWFNLRDFRSAAAAQRVLIANYPESPKIPDALLNLGSSYAALGDASNARKTLEDLVARYPQSDAAEKGKARLARLK
jgi:tol-pal system protein YbgF